MRQKMKLWLGALLLAAALGISPAAGAFAEETTGTTTENQSTDTSTGENSSTGSESTDGESTDGGSTDGGSTDGESTKTEEKKITGWHKISGKKYYYNEDGEREIGWTKIGSKTYYLYKKGGMATGWTKIKGKTYYFSKKGVLKKGKTNNAKKNATRLNGLIINKKGVCTTDGKTSTNVMITLQKQLKKDLKAAGVKATTKKSRKKINQMFRYLCRKCYYQHLAINPYATTFSTSSALRMLKKGRGNCYCYGAAFAYLVKAATGYETRVSYGVCTITRGWGRGTYSHGWTEIKIGGQWKIFDVELYDRGSYSSRYSTGKTYRAMRAAGTTYRRIGSVKITL